MAHPLRNTAHSRQEQVPVIGRFAPSPTGPLHFGSLLAALASYCLARQAGGRWLLRMEDLDTPRVVPGAAEDILRTLERLGLEWDGEIVWQSQRTAAYEGAAAKLRDRGLVFDCGCTRKEVLASAPHPGEEGPVYPGLCRDGLPAGRKPRALRVKVPHDPVCFRDGVFGVREQHLHSAVGDFVIKRADGLFAYQLAVVVDDADAGVNQVVRGEDLLSSTPRQIYLQSCLELPIPAYVHIPLAVDAQGEKLSKRHGAALSVAVSPGRAIYEALVFLGQKLPGELAAATAQEVLAWGVLHFDLARVPAKSAIWPTTENA